MSNRPPESEGSPAPEGERSPDYKGRVAELADGIWSESFRILKPFVEHMQSVSELRLPRYFSGQATYDVEHPGKPAHFPELTLGNWFWGDYFLDGTVYRPDHQFRFQSEFSNNRRTLRVCTLEEYNPALPGSIHAGPTLMFDHFDSRLRRPSPFRKQRLSRPRRYGNRILQHMEVLVDELKDIPPIRM